MDTVKGLVNIEKISTFVTLLLLLLSTLFAHAVDYPYHPVQRVDFTSSNLPIVVINLDVPMKAKNANERTGATITILNRKDGGRNRMSDLDELPDFTNSEIFDYHGKIQIKHRGNTSFSESEKKPFSVHTVDESREKIDANILNMGAHHDWVLLAPFSDKSLMRDVLTYELQEGYFDYTPKARFCEVVLEGVYQGVYAVVARARRGKNRLDLPKPGLSGDALSGGYHLVIDRSHRPGFYLTHKPRKKSGALIPYPPYAQLKYPDPDNIQEKQMEYIQSFLENFEDTLAGDEFKDPVHGYQAHLDDMSAIDFMLTQEFTRNIDGYRLSTPIYKYNNAKDPRLKFSIWDFNIALGNANYLDGDKEYGWCYLELNESNPVNAVPFWFPRLMEDEAFVFKFTERWCQYRSTTHSNEYINHKIDSIAILLNEAQERNFKAWNLLGRYVWPNAFVGATWDEELDYLKEYTIKRAEWMDRELGLHPVDMDYAIAMPSVACKDVKVRLSSTPPEGMVFDSWGGDIHLLDDPYSDPTTFIMPDEYVYFFAIYKEDISNEKRASSEKILVYPSPANNYIRVGGVENTSYVIINLLGQVALNGSGYSGEAIDISSLQPGGYIIRTNEEALFFMKK